MLSFIKGFRKVREERRAWLDFYEEIEKNLESYYVMFQLGRLRFFQLEHWLKQGANPAVVSDRNVQHYGQRLQEYNQILEGFKKFEQWYASDINNKTKENGVLLHQKREEAETKFNGLESVILEAKKAFALQLQEKKILKS